MKNPNGFGSVLADDIALPKSILTNNKLTTESDEAKFAIQNAYNKDLYELIEIQKLDGYYSSEDVGKVIANSKFNQVWFNPGDVWCYKESTNYSATEGSTATSQSNVQYFVPVGIVKSVLSTGYMPNDIDAATQRRQNPDIINSTRITLQKLKPDALNAGIINTVDQPHEVAVPEFLAVMAMLYNLLMESGGNKPLYIIRKNINQVIEPAYRIPTSNNQKLPTSNNQKLPTSNNQKLPTSNNQKLPTSNNQKDNPVAIIAAAASVLLLVLILKDRLKCQ